MKLKISTTIVYFIFCSLLGWYLISSIRPRLFIPFSLFIPIGLLVIFHFNRWLKLTHKNLLKQPLFIASVALPFYMFIIYGLWAWKGHNINFTSEGFNSFLEISKLPLIILASSVPLAAIVSNIHRTIQTEAQINSSEIKNSIDRYLSHEKNFVEKIKEMAIFTMQNYVEESSKHYNHGNDKKTKLLTAHEIRISNPYLLYSKIYTKSTTDIHSNYSPDMDFKNEIVSILDTIEYNLSVARESTNDNPEDFITRLNTISYNTAKLMDILCVDCISMVTTTLTLNDLRIKTFTPQEGILCETLEAGFYLTKKILKMTYNLQINNYKNIYSYLYDGVISLSSDKIRHSLVSFYSPEWSAYVSEQPEFFLLQQETIDSGDKVATEV
ncbi:hypothetical protein [Citrobacter europaeus]|uniref:hypothetical protein n=1 Tax=Citrobacter europaeus TaxID=1914243 RepID=UPI001C806315|nr:hypothetical protein [Citrobacter europaeus]